jgi:hypothetical protein
MNNSLPVRAIELRYPLTWHLFDRGPATVTELIDALAAQGFRALVGALGDRVRPGAARSVRPGVDAPGNRAPDQPMRWRCGPKSLSCRSKVGNNSIAQFSRRLR